MTGQHLGDLLQRIPQQLRTPGQQLPRRELSAVVAGLGQVVGGISPADLRGRGLGPTAVEAIRTLQQQAALPVTGTLDDATLARLHAEVAHRYMTTTATRIERVQEMLSRTGFPPAPGEMTSKQFGDSTADAVRRFQEANRLTVDGLLGNPTIEALRERALAARLSTKRQIGIVQRAMLRAARVKGIQVSIDAAEMKSRSSGASTQAAIRDLQGALNLPVTGTIDLATYQRITSVAASRTAPKPLVPKQDPSTLRTLPRTLRLNASNKHVPALQRALTFLGHPVDEREFKAARYGGSTRAAVIAFQRSASLPLTGQVDKATLRAVNQAISTASPAAGAGPAPRIRGCVRDESWRGMAGVTVELRIAPMRGQGDLLGSRKTLTDGFYDLPYVPPKDPSSGQPVSPLNLAVSFIDASGNTFATKKLLNPTPVAWVNWTAGPYPFQGPSEYQTLVAAVLKASGGIAITDLQETADQLDISHVAQVAGLLQDDVMRIVLAQRAAPVIADAQIGADVIYGYLGQGLPANLPDTLLAATHEWELIDQLTNMAVSGLAFMDPVLQGTALDQALAANLVPIATQLRTGAILAAFSALRQRYALDQPLLVGNGSLRSLLSTTSVPEPSYTAVADTFVTSGGLGEQFWTQVRANPQQYGGDAAVADLELSVDAGMIAKNYPPMLQYFRQRITDPGDATLKSSRDIAKLSVPELEAIIQANGDSVPPSTDGSTPEERRATYASTMASQSERLFPTVALAAEAGRSPGNILPRLPDITALIDQHPDLELRTVNIDAFAGQKALSLDADLHSQMRVLQRVNRLAPTASAGRALLDNGIHSSIQMVSLGRAETVRRLQASGIDQRVALTMHGYAEFMYAQVLARIGEWRSELQRANPVAISPQTLTAGQRSQLLGQVPDLELLFGPVDVCDCPHCASVYGPAAYLADVLRFLDAHPAQAGSGTVRGVLAERRPDIAAIKLNCVNTETALPYIDLVCEILEAEVVGAAAAQDRQTTWTADQLRAAPEHEEQAAYESLRTADAPMTGTFDLWQEQTRVFLDLLGVPRWQLMDAFRDAAAANTPADDIAAEYWGISSHERGIVTTEAPDAAAQQNFWGFDATRAQVPVPEMLDHSHLTYPDLLMLLEAEFITPAGAPQRVALARPLQDASLATQSIVNLTPAALDRIHRLIRLSRHLPWDLWQLDLLLRAPRLGNGALDGRALVCLEYARQLQTRLGAGPEALATWFGTIPTTGHPDGADPSDPAKRAASAYALRFANPAVADPPDPAFALPLAGGDLSAHRPTLLGALTVTDTELTLLFDRVGTTFDLPTLSALASWVGLARSMGRSVAELRSLADLAAPVIPDPFAAPDVLVRFLDIADAACGSGIGVGELDYLLNARPDSPYSPGDDVVMSFATRLRESLRTNPAADPAGQAAAHLAGVLDLTAQQCSMLLGLPGEAGTMTADFTDARITAADAAGVFVHDLTPAEFPALYADYRKLLKIARILRGLGIDDTVLAWLLQHGDDVSALHPADLPVEVAPATPLFPGWLALTRWIAVRRALIDRAAAAATVEPGVTVPGTPAATPEDLVAAAANPASAVADVRAVAADLVSIDAATLAVLDGGAAAAYRDSEFVSRLLTGARQLHRLGVDGATGLIWAVRDGGAPGAAIASAVRQAAKSKYDEPAWLTTVTPIADEIRQRKRDALVAYLIERSARTEPESVTIAGDDYVNPRRWHDSDDLLSYFLVDVEMMSCQLTSRIKQATGSTQLFVQRCLLNLEQPEVVITDAQRADQVSLDSWRQWTWMKSYRLWEANRKIFLYPENWIQPELRDDKSPFFTDLENELRQGEITTDTCEAALRHYLEKVDAVSNMKVAGIYHEAEDDNPYDSLPPATNVLHVIGRSRTDPPRYCYRTFDLNMGSWTSWEKIDLDITGDHVVPVVHNRILHLFWLQIEQKQQPGARQPVADKTTGSQQAPQPPKQLEIKLAWTTRRGEGFGAKQLSPHTLIHPWERPADSYTLKPRYKSQTNQLWMDVYVTTSLRFNNQRFYDPYGGGFAFATARRFDETARPWHSSSFVFDGQVLAVKLKPLRGQYHVLDGAGVPSETLQMTTSYQFVHDSTDAGADIQPLSGGFEIAPRMALPDGMHFRANRLVNNTRRPNNGRLAVLESGNTVTLLTRAQPPFELCTTLQNIQMDTAGSDQTPVFYADAMRSYFVRSDFVDVQIDSTQTVRRLRYTFYPFMHPYTALFLRELNRSGIEGVLNRTIQGQPQAYPPQRTFSFTGTYGPVAGTAAVDPSSEKDVLDFSPAGAMSIYNWELFFHIPFLIACRLSANQRFEEALSWFHRIFDPTNTDAFPAPQRYWITLPFFVENDEDYRRQRIEDILADISSRLDQVRAWKNDPFKPDVIARFRPVAYQKAVVMKYIDNLIAWGDQLFRQDTIEVINEATLLYVLAAEILGPRPEHVPPILPPEKSYDELVADAPLDPFGNKDVEVQLENFADRPTLVISTDASSEALPLLKLQYFGIPGNTDLLAYWDTVADRLFKIRNCVNIAGIVRQLPLFEPPIDPAVLIRAVAAGVDLGSVLADTPGAGSPYRCRTLMAKALELTGEVSRLGERMLAALDRQDAEGLAVLQATNEVSLRTAITAVRQEEVLAAQRTREALEAGLDAVQERIDYFGGVPYMNAWEIASTVAHGLGVISDIVATVLHTIGGAASLVPKVTVGAEGFGGSPVVTVTYGGENIARSSVNFAALFQGLATILHNSGQMMQTQGSFQRTYDFNQFQMRLGQKERDQLQAQIAAAQVREVVAGYELAAHNTAVSNSEAVASYFTTKYTNKDLFDWLAGQVADVYFQAYQLAFDMARRAQNAMRFELDQVDDPPYIRFGYWDSLKKGLLAGDRLANDIRRMEARYLELNTRRLEATTHVSLATLFPDKLLELTTLGRTVLDLPEWVFAMEHPGLYDMRFQSLAISVPCTTGPYVGVHAGVTLTNAVVRVNDSTNGGFGDALHDNDARFQQQLSPVTSIITSHGSADRGSNEPNWDYDDRYQAFEGAGVLCQLAITLDPRDNQFDLNTVTDFVLHVEYSARQGGAALVDAARQAVLDALPAGGVRLLSLDGDFAGPWYQFLHPAQGAEQVLAMPIGIDQFPFLIRRAAKTATLSVLGADLVVDTDVQGPFDVRIAAPGEPLATTHPMTSDANFGGLHHAGFSWAPGTRPLLGDWQIQMKRDSDPGFTGLPPDAVTHAYLLLRFTLT